MNKRDFSNEAKYPFSNANRALEFEPPGTLTGTALGSHIQAAQRKVYCSV